MAAMILANSMFLMLITMILMNPMSTLQCISLEKNRHAAKFSLPRGVNLFIDNL